MFRLWPAILICIGLACAAGADVQVWLTRGDQVSLLEARPSLTFQPGAGTHSTRIRVDPGVSYQRIDGFGAALTDSAAWLMQYRLSTAQREALLAQLFSPVDGIGLSCLRMPLGASDFALSAYTYNDLPPGQTDPTLAHFSIAHDELYIIPLLQQARALNPDLQLMVSPWSPPAWMKTSQSLYGGSLAAGWHATYAQYFVRVLQAYAAHDLAIHALTVQNEPRHNTAAIPSAGMSATQQRLFIGQALGPALAAAGFAPRILCYDHNWDAPDYPLAVLSDPVARSYIAGTAFHGYGGEVAAQTVVHDAYPDKEIHFTEISGGDWATSFPDNLVWFAHNIVIGSTRHWAQTVLAWNLALDENHGPHLPGGCSGCRGVVTIQSATGVVTPEVEYYALGHASRFVRPGARRIASDSFDGTLETVAFRNANGSEVLIALNPSGSSHWFDVVRGGQFFAYRLTPRSVATFVWLSPPTGDADNDGDVDAADFGALAGTAPTNLLVNAGFEDGATGNLAAGIPGWGTWGNSGWHHDDAGRVIDTKALKLWWDDSGVWQDVPVRAGTQYTYQVQAFNSSFDPLVGWRGQLQAEFYDSTLGTDPSHALANVSVDTYDPASDPLDAWVALSGTVTAPAGADIGRMVLRLSDWQAGVQGALNYDAAALLRLQPGCWSGPDASVTTGCSATFDFDNDADVDLHDVAMFQRYFGTN